LRCEDALTAYLLAISDNLTEMAPIAACLLSKTAGEIVSSSTFVVDQT
jgi:hypothetical protein